MTRFLASFRPEGAVDILFSPMTLLDLGTAWRWADTRDHPAFTRGRLRKLYHHPKSIGTFAMAHTVEEPRGEFPVAFALVRRHPRWIEILALAVDPDFRRRGIGRSLLSHLSHENGQRPLVAVVPEHNDGAIAFCQALGYRATLLRGHFGGEDGLKFVGAGV